jgi:hypothetical protein
MEWDRCDNGLCLTDDTCAEFCDWETSYFDTSTCPEGTNCLVQSIMYSEDPQDPNDDGMEGLRTSEFGFCLEQAEDPAEGVYTCDLVNGELVKNRAQSCADINADWICQPLAFSETEVAFGVPIGICGEPVQQPNVDLWAECDPANDYCPEGSICFSTDTTDPAATSRCMPYCLVEGENPCARLGVPTDAECYSMSAWYRPGSTQGSTDDGSPSPLGLCACPEGGCTGFTTCGNDQIDGDEVCDGTALGGMQCSDYGDFTGGDLACNATCDATDPSGCTTN